MGIAKTEQSLVADSVKLSGQEGILPRLSDKLFQTRSFGSTPDAGTLFQCVCHELQEGGRKS